MTSNSLLENPKVSFLLKMFQNIFTKAINKKSNLLYLDKLGVPNR